jgi:uncharacterized protein YdaU (DUF1376 family)
MSNRRPWFPFYGEDFFSATKTWALAAQAAYLKLLWHQWTEGSVPINDPKALRRITGLSAYQWREFSDAIVSKFSDAGTNKRLDTEISKVLEISKKRQAAVKTRYTNVPTNVDTPTPTPTKKKKVSKKEPSNGSAVEVVLPGYIPKQLWADFVEMRVKCRARPTRRASEILLRKLEGLRAEGENPIEVLEQSISNSWKGLFSVHNQNGNGKVKNGGPNQDERVLARIMEAASGVGGESSGSDNDAIDALLPRTPTN